MVAQETLTPVPADRRGQLREFVRARVALNGIDETLTTAAQARDDGGGPPDLQAMTAAVYGAVQRIEAAAHAVELAYFPKSGPRRSRPSVGQPPAATPPSERDRSPLMTGTSGLPPRRPDPAAPGHGRGAQAAR